ncbi:MAG: transglycosylase SLT domain-containing protein [Campylobacteraceae bacterium]|jgi:soluble lytic murein transglycosylase|nr:transglycosylase SLT domain-containing protein [Campylobacteraceae bacterium]
MRYKSIFIIILCLACAACANKLSFDEIKTKPKSLAKDYYIYRLLSENGSVTTEQAASLYDEVSRMNPNLKSEFVKKIGLSESDKQEQACRDVAKKNISNLPDECVKLIIYPSFVLSLDNSTRDKLKTRLLKLNYDFAAGWVEAMGAKDVFTALSKKGAKEFLLVFNGVSESYRKTYLDKNLTQAFVKELSSDKGFEKFVKTVAIGEPRFQALPKSLLYDTQNASLTFESFFFLGINAAKFKKKKLAENFFQKAEQKAYSKVDKDKSLFWQYLVSSNNETLTRLSESYNINIYSLYAKELLGVYISGVTFLTSSENKSKENFNIKDPFAWKALLDEAKNTPLEEMEKLALRFNSKETLPIYAFLMERGTQYRQSYFTEPYSEYLEGIKNERKAMILSLGRKESYLVPATISTSYALGMMQFMPFLARDTAAALKMKDFDIDDMFDPKIAYKFANIHLDYLNLYLYHPLFVAYAYNGGIGFTRRMLQSGHFFNNGEYEPFLSMETISYEESREYGKSVLAYYVVYSKQLGLDVSLKALLKALTKPAETDEFRQ